MVEGVKGHDDSMKNKRKGHSKDRGVMKMRLSDIPFPFSFQYRQSFNTHDRSRLARQDEYNYNYNHYTRTYLLEADRITTRRPS